MAAGRARRASGTDGRVRPAQPWLPPPKVRRDACRATLRRLHWWVWCVGIPSTPLPLPPLCCLYRFCRSDVSSSAQRETSRWQFWDRPNSARDAPPVSTITYTVTTRVDIRGQREPGASASRTDEPAQCSASTRGVGFSVPDGGTPSPTTERPASDTRTPSRELGETRPSR